MSNFFLGFDTETGSLHASEGDLLTMYACIMDEDYKIIDELDLKLKPDNRLPLASSEALNKNGIDLAKHMADPETITYSEGKKKLVEMTKKYLKKVRNRSNIVPFGYNILGFDIEWVQYHLLPRTEWSGLFHYKSVDVMCNVDFLKQCNWLPSNIGTLSTVVDYLGLQKRNAHEAKNDVLMTIDVHKKILDIMKYKKEGGQVQDLISLLETE